MTVAVLLSDRGAPRSCRHLPRLLRDRPGTEARSCRAHDRDVKGASRRGRTSVGHRHVSQQSGRASGSRCRNVAASRTKALAAGGHSPVSAVIGGYHLAFLIAAGCNDRGNPRCLRAAAHAGKASGSGRRASGDARSRAASMATPPKRARRYGASVPRPAPRPTSGEDVGPARTATSPERAADPQPSCAGRALHPGRPN